MNLLLTLASATLISAALPNEVLRFGSAFAGLVALAPILYAIYLTPSRRSAAKFGMLFGAVSTALSNYWLAFFGEFSIWTIGGAVAGYAGYNYLLFSFLHFVAHRGSQTRTAPIDNPLRPLTIAVLWTAYEYLKSTGFLGFPWGLIAYPLSGISAVAQIADITGVWGLSFLGAFANAAVAEVLVSRHTRNHPAIARRTLPGRSSRRWHQMPIRHLAASVALIAIAAGYGMWSIPRFVPEDSVAFLLVQQNVDSWKPGRFPIALATAQELTLEALREAEDQIDAVVWSETSLRYPYTPDSEFYRNTPKPVPFPDFIEMIEVPLVTGVPMESDSDPTQFTNSAVVLAPDGSILGSYAKQQLVPFAERIPYLNVPTVRSFFRNAVGLIAGWTPGTVSQTIELPVADGKVIRIGTPICFEDAFTWVSRDLVRNGARILVNLTNNSWSRQDSAQIQHYVAARLRAIELRTTLVRSTNSGLTTVVDATGNPLETVPMFTSTAAIVQVPVYPARRTLAKALGDWLAVAFTVLSALNVGWFAIERQFNVGRGGGREKPATKA